MRRTVHRRVGVPRNLEMALALFGVAVGAVGAGETALLASYSTGGPYWVLVLFPLVGWVYVATGVLAWVRRPANRMGPLLCVGGLMWLSAGASNLDIAAFLAVGAVTQTLPIAFVVHALLAFPSGRLPTLTSRVLTVSIYVVAVVLEAPLYLFRPLGPEPDVLRLADRPDLLALGEQVQTIAGFVVLGATGVVLVRRLVVGDWAQRRVLLPVYGCGAVVVAGVTSGLYLLKAVGINDPVVITVFQVLTLTAMPVAFVAGVLLGGFARTGELEELGEWLGASGARPDLRDALARTLGDPTVRLGYRFGEGWVDAIGMAVELPAPGTDRGAVLVELDGRPVGAIIYDAHLFADPEPVRAAGRVVAIALDRQRLTAQLLASQEELRESRTRLVEAGDQERRRLAQDLHDRLQGRLTLLALRVGNAAPGDDLAGIRRGLDESITELRWLVQGVMPALLLERGLTAAVEDMADRTPIHTVLDFSENGCRLDETRLPQSVEGTAYAVIAEALTNAVKHAAADTVTVTVRREGGRLWIEVADDGVGGAGPAGGLGLRGMTDRVQALGGTLVINSPPSAGTRVVAELPCAS